MILLFLGWGMDAMPFRSLMKPGYDIVALYDYTDDDAPPCMPPGSYGEVVVVAWSFGVRAAADFMRSASMPVTRTIAVNGTESHVDDSAGIPRRIFDATMASLSEASIEKFRRRMFRSMDDYKDFGAVAPGRGFESLKEELEVFARVAPAAVQAEWSMAVIGGRDLIFPPDAQRHAWRDVHVEEFTDMPHFADLQMILDRFVVDKELVATRFAGASHTYDANAAVQSEAAAWLWRRVKDTAGLPDAPVAVLEVGAGSGMLTRRYLPELNLKSLEIWDLAAPPLCPLPACARTVICDAESRIDAVAPGSLDFMLSSSTVQWFHAPEKFLRKAAVTLRPGGVMALTYYAQGTCRELAVAGGVSLAYPCHARMLEALAGSGLEIVYEDTAPVVARFDSPREALRHLKTTGVNALGRNSRAGAAAIGLVRHYPLDDDGKAPLTFVKACIIAVKK